VRRERNGEQRGAEPGDAEDQRAEESDCRERGGLAQFYCYTFTDGLSE
jgi:hypothetical protein